DLLSRVTDSVETALGLASGVLEIDFVDEQEGSKARRRTFSEKLSCPNGHPIQLTEIEPRTFSFNAPFGACPECSGLGTKMAVDIDLVVGDPELSLNEGVILPWNQGGKGLYSYFQRLLQGLARDLDFSLDTPWGELPDEVRTSILRGNDFEVVVQWRNRFGRTMKYSTGFEGVMPYLERKYHEAESDWSQQRYGEYLREVPCPVCDGKRLKPEVLAVLVAGRSISDTADLSITDAYEVMQSLELTERQARIAAQVLREIRLRLEFLLEVGLGYLTMARAAATLSGGEAQRIRLATQI
ncbi:excinuclease ABC subunit A, partial [Schumannella luteola]